MKEYTYFVSGYASFNDGGNGWFDKDVTVNGRIYDRTILNIVREHLKTTLNANEVIIVNFKLY
jgi:hypothetical protein